MSVPSATPTLVFSDSTSDFHPLCRDASHRQAVVYSDQELSGTHKLSMLTRQWRSWPANAVVHGEHEHVVDPGRRWVPSPEAQLFALPADAAGEQGSAASPSRVVPDIKSTQRTRRLSIPPPSRDGEGHDPLARMPSRLSVKYWKSRLGVCLSLNQRRLVCTDRYVIGCHDMQV